MKALQLTHTEYAGIFGRLALLLRSGIPLGDGLRLLGEEEKDESLAAALSGMADRLDTGEYLSDAMDKAECFFLQLLMQLIFWQKKHREV